MSKIIKISEMLESESEHDITDILSSFKIENMKQIVSKNDNYYYLNFNSTSQIYYIMETNTLLCFTKSSDGKFNLLDNTELMNNISKKLNTGECSYKVKRNLNNEKSFGFIIERDLVHEIALYCEDILLELKDIGFDVKTMVSSQQQKNRETIRFLPPLTITFFITRNNKFKYSSDEEEKPIFYQTGRGFDVVNLADYIDSLSDYLNEIGYGTCMENYQYGNGISLKFELKKKNYGLSKEIYVDDLDDEDDDDGDGDDDDGYYMAVRAPR